VKRRRKETADEADLPLPVPEDLKAGDSVRLIRMDQTGEVIGPPDDRGDVQVQVGRIRMTVPLRDLRLLPGEGKSARPKRTGSGSYYAGVIRSKITTITSSLDVHGENLDDAEHRVDKYLDDAFLAGLGDVSIVHGRGEGILREGLRKMLKSHRHVQKIRPGGPGEGGEGATIVTLRT
jgi:DNA mismatch repair protein MutS2